MDGVTEIIGGTCALVNALIRARENVTSSDGSFAPVPDVPNVFSEELPPIIALVAALNLQLMNRNLTKFRRLPTAMKLHQAVDVLRRSVGTKTLQLQSIKDATETAIWRCTGYADFSAWT